MEDFKIGSVVKIVRPPSDFLQNLIGMVGFTGEFSEYKEETFVQFCSLDKSGSVTDVLAIRVNCLEVVSDPEWLRAKELYDIKKAELELYYKSHPSGWESAIKKMSSKYWVSEEDVLAIYNYLDKDWEYDE